MRTGQMLGGFIFVSIMNRGPEVCDFQKGAKNRGVRYGLPGERANYFLLHLLKRSTISCSGAGVSRETTTMATRAHRKAGSNS